MRLEGHEKYCHVSAIVNSLHLQNPRQRLVLSTRTDFINNTGPSVLHHSHGDLVTVTMIHNNPNVTFVGVIHDSPEVFSIRERSSLSVCADASWEIFGLTTTVGMTMSFHL